nr:hypothetical protein [Cupriavidus pinatubonensis]
MPNNGNRYTLKFALVPVCSLAGVANKPVRAYCSIRGSCAPA